MVQRRCTVLMPIVRGRPQVDWTSELSMAPNATVKCDVCLDGVN